MKNLFKSAIMLTACALTMCLTTSCSNDDDNDSPATKTFNELVKEDCELVQSKYSTVEVRFLEVDAMMNGYFDETDAKQLKIAEMTSVFQAGQLAVLVKHDLAKGTREFEEVKDVWLECEDMHIEDFKITFEEAVAIMKKSDYSNIHTKYLTLREPVAKIPYGTPMYIFGTYAGVSVKDGRIILMNPADKSFNDLMKEDCEFINEKYSSAQKIRFLEVDAMMNGYFDETDADKLKIAEMTSIYQVDQKVVFVIHDIAKGTKDVEEIADIFEGSDDMFIEDFKVTFKDAVKIMKNSEEYKDIHTRYLTVRKPVYKDKYDYPLYIFGKYAGVEVKSGEIISMTDLSFNDAMIDDYNWAREKYGKDVSFYEVHAELNGFIDEMQPNQIHVVCDTAVFEKNNVQTIFVARNFDKGIRHTFTNRPGWTGSVQFNPYDIRVSFKEAVRIFAESEIPYTKHISVMTFRQIMDPKFEHPMYIFGRVAGVDAVTGDVIRM